MACPYSTQPSINELRLEDMSQGVLDGTQPPMGSTLSLPNGDTVASRSSVGVGINKALARIQTANPEQPARLVDAPSTATRWDSATISDPAHDGEPGPLHDLAAGQRQRCLQRTRHLGGSACWGGLAVRDANGKVASGATLVSGSGHDWRLPVGLAAVPEPAKAWLMMLGVAALGLRLRRRPAAARAA